MNTKTTSKAVRDSETITEKQAFALGVVSVLIRRNPDILPTLAEIAKYLNVTVTTARELLVVLERKGYITRSRGTHRSIRLTDKPLPFATQKWVA